ncbi:helix-turn-helix domain-containing protein [Thermoactinomyces sp. DSM 45892]|uniref:helix-turn-helix domain-containing protein n=1 Tax=Thermoactinomyces sp. DSM 45892 TaxID=1882753 RepID=UPI0008999831|nr:helix-turn-helix transcriptional regulator [Thermoactinomyces sp. DSM 45892]SDY99984.1 Helix-turn-helix domain-containing protein [Thermoactinomyces sp. DSM 45892]
MFFKRDKSKQKDTPLDTESSTPKQEELRDYLRSIRKQKNKTLAQIADTLKVTESYMSQIENGKRVPSDLFIRELAQTYQIDERILFEKMEKIPLGVYEALESNKTLQNILSGIRYNKKLPDEEKQKLIDEIYQLYIDRLKYYEESIRNQKGGDKR